MKKLNILFLSALLSLPFSVVSQESTIWADVKFSAAMNNIRSFYVDSVNEEKLVEIALRALLKELDPHSVYLTKDEINRANEALTGNFEGVGVTFQIYTDSILVVGLLHNGPAERAGLRTGDRIIRIDKDSIGASELSNSWVVNRLRGSRGSTVEVEVFRRSTAEKINIGIVRDRIPIFSVESGFMLDNKTAYLKLNRFSGKTMSEFYAAFVDFKFSGMQNMILDLRGNSGGYLQTSIDLADEFLGRGNLIVYTEGLNHPRQNYRSTSKGEIKKGRLVVLIDERSASASEILAGAIQDCDRGLIIGRRSYGKGLVQRPYYLPDGSAIRLTTARYYTPSGRSIQKPYSDGVDNYFRDLSTRMKRGEHISMDSLNFPVSLKYQTGTGREVYGGGGIMPDIFIPSDTTLNLLWYRKIISANLPYIFAIKYVDDNREYLNKAYPSFQIFNMEFQVGSEMLDSFMTYCTQRDISADTLNIEPVVNRMPVLIKAHIASLLFENKHYHIVAAELDDTLMKALEIINDKEYFRRFNIDY